MVLPMILFHTRKSWKIDIYKGHRLYPGVKNLRLIFGDEGRLNTLNHSSYGSGIVGICELPFHPVSSEVIGGVGGTCVIRGCVPQKKLVYGVAFGGELKDAKSFGWELNEKIDFNWKKLLQKKTDEIIRLNNIYKRLLSNAGVKLYEGEGRIVGPNEVQVTQIDGTKLSYSAKRVLTATGSRAQRPNFPGQRRQFGVVGGHEALGGAQHQRMNFLFLCRRNYVDAPMAKFSNKFPKSIAEYEKFYHLYRDQLLKGYYLMKMDKINEIIVISKIDFVNLVMFCPIKYRSWLWEELVRRRVVVLDSENLPSHWPVQFFHNLPPVKQLVHPIQMLIPIKPSDSWIKIYVDASYSEKWSSTEAGGGVVLLDPSGNVRLFWTKVAARSAFIGEGYVIYSALTYVWRNGFTRVELVSDCLDWVDVLEGRSYVRDEYINLYSNLLNVLSQFDCWG
ncbi:uncharacterized protein LOC110725530 [Chenopodium quinoa]|uniref:uncharacterized protein LOC110725530 n=1 Tax=Chenopodium quinoa TaxID=63459 RepID=UPI000B790B4D|nr:uncharacterized protein LOC110725530 [Chenopodium quinoa]